MNFSPSERLSYTEMLRRARELADYMQQIELPERFVMLFADPRESLIATYAAMFSGRTGLPILPLTSCDAGLRLAGMMQNAQIDTVLLAPQHLPTLSRFARPIYEGCTLHAVHPLEISPN